MMKYWHKICPRCVEGRLFFMKHDDSDALFLTCEECECTYKHPDDTTSVENGFLGIDIEGEFATKDEI